ncbi:MAG: ABC transporter ATP-binding protein [Candidatus Sericytochromatia bacterium]|nr:ABC transporter ATP-binding protein [Candidatus Sericytochromatia bacterium]
MSDFIVQTKNLIKSYGKHNALDSLNMNVKEGFVYGLLGKNGAGKTTTLRMIMSLLKPTNGSIDVMGYEPTKMPIKQRQNIGYASDSMQLIPWLKVGEILNYNGSFYDTWDKEYVKQWADRLGLSLDKRVFQLSRGNRQKLGLIMAIGHRPKLVVLDEPAGGLDPIARKEFLESIIELIHELGTTIILSSHALSDLERISDYIGIIDQGKMQVEMSLEDLKSSTRQIKIVSKNKLENISFEDTLKLNSTEHLITGIFKNWDDDKSKKIIQKFPNATVEIQNLNLEEIFLAYAGK